MFNTLRGGGCNIGYVTEEHRDIIKNGGIGEEYQSTISVKIRNINESN